MATTDNYPLPLPPDSTLIKDTAKIIRESNTVTDGVLAAQGQRVETAETAATEGARAAREAADLVGAPADPVVAALLAGSGSAAAAALYRQLNGAFPGALTPWLTALRNQKTAPAVYVSLGSSTAGGHGASVHERSWIQRIAARFGPNPAAGLDLAKPANGVQVYNGAIGGTQSVNYLSDADRDKVIALRPHLITHMIGSNDWAVGRTPAEYKTTLRAKVEQLRNALPGTIQILVHQQNRFDTPAAAVHPWPAYGAAMAEIAASFPSNVLYLDLSQKFEALGLSYNPSVLWGGDRIHLNDDGHRVLADLIAPALGAPAILLPRTILNATPTKTGNVAAAATIATFKVPPRAHLQQVIIDVSLFTGMVSGEGTADFEIRDTTNTAAPATLRAFRVEGIAAAQHATAWAEIPAHKEATFSVQLTRLDSPIYVSASSAWHSITADVSPL